MTKRPNILLFITNDHAPWKLPCYSNGESHAPTLDHLALSGVVFDNAFTPTPICSPGRACLLTSLTASQHGVHDWIAMHEPECQERDWLARQVTLSEILGQSGYRCGLAGKWHIGRDFECPRSYDWYFGFAIQGGHEGITTYIKNGRAQVRRGNVTEHVTDSAIAFLETSKPDQPFFLHIGYTDATFEDIRVDEPHPNSWNEGIPEGATVSTDDVRLRHANQYAAVGGHRSSYGAYHLASGGFRRVGRHDYYLHLRTRFGEYGDLRTIRTPTRKIVRRYSEGRDEMYDLVSVPEEKVDVIRCA